MMETINELKEKIHFYKLTIQDIKEHYGEFEMETNQEIKEKDELINHLQQRIDKAVEFINKWKQVDGDGSVFFDINTKPNELLNILKGEKNND